MKDGPSDFQDTGAGGLLPPKEAIAQVVDGRGAVVNSSEGVTDGRLLSPSQPHAARRSALSLTTVDGGTSLRLLAVPVPDTGHPPTVLVLAAGVLTVAGIGAGAVASHAATPGTPHTVASVTRADTHHVQQADQTSPDVPGAPTDEAATTSAVAKKVAQHTARTHTARSHSDRGHSARGHSARGHESRSTDPWEKASRQAGSRPPGREPVLSSKVTRELGSGPDDHLAPHAHEVVKRAHIGVGTRLGEGHLEGRPRHQETGVEVPSGVVGGVP